MYSPRIEIVPPLVPTVPKSLSTVKVPPVIDKPSFKIAMSAGIEMNKMPQTTALKMYFEKIKLISQITSAVYKSGDF